MVRPIGPGSRFPTPQRTSAVVFTYVAVKVNFSSASTDSDLARLCVSHSQQRGRSKVYFFWFFWQKEENEAMLTQELQNGS